MQDPKDGTRCLRALAVLLVADVRCFSCIGQALAEESLVRLSGIGGLSRLVDRCTDDRARQHLEIKKDDQQELFALFDAAVQVRVRSVLEGLVHVKKLRTRNLVARDPAGAVSCKANILELLAFFSRFFSD